MTKNGLQELYYQMLRIRIVEETISSLYSEQQMRCPVHLCIGQEAIAVGACASLAPGDFALSAHRSHGHYLAKGGSLKAMLAELYGKVTGCARGKGGSMHLVDVAAGFLGATPIVGSTIAIAVGVAFASMLRRQRAVTVVFFGEGATEEGVFHEAANFAVLKRLPIVFVCENNFFSVYSPLEVRQPEGREVFCLAKGYGLPAFQGDGNNVVEVGELTRTAVARARAGDGPTFLEFKTYRWREHCGPNFDDHLNYRSAGEFASWKERCPVESMQARLGADGQLTADEIATFEKRIHAEVQEAVAFAKTSPFPAAEDLLEGIYA